MKTQALVVNRGYIKFVLPTYLLFLLLTIIPVFGTIGLSTFQFDIATPVSSIYVGLENYLDLLEDDEFINSFKVMCILILIPVFLQMVLGSALALALHEKPKGLGWVRSLFLVPAVLPPVVIGLIWKLFFIPGSGGLAYFGNWFGLPMIDMFSDSLSALIMVIIASVWAGIPFVTLMLLANLETLPASCYEAANIDGAGWWQRHYHITWPLMTPIVKTITIFRVLEALAIFPVIFVLTGGGPAGATEPINFFAYRVGFDYLMLGYASAVIVIFFCILFLICLPLMLRVFASRGN